VKDMWHKQVWPLMYDGFWPVGQQAILHHSLALSHSRLIF